MNFTIGILGGMGPRATVQFEGLLIEKIVGGDQDMPTIITVNDGSIPDRSSFLVGSGKNPVPRLLKNLKILENSGASIICMPCNTACTPVIFDRLQTSSSIRIINLPEEVSRELLSLHSARVLIMATEGTIRSCVYQSVCNRNGLTPIVPDPETQKIVNQLIYDIKTNNRTGILPLAEEIKRYVKKTKADTVILGCTELPMVSNRLLPQECIAIDTLEILVKATLFYAREDDSIKEITNEIR